MTLGGSELQVFVTFLVILACAFVALLMDYLKGNNEQLRERHVDLLVRQEQYAGKPSIDAAVLARSLEKVLGEQTAALKEIVVDSIKDLPLRESEETRKGGLLEPHGYVSSLKDLPVWEIPEPKRAAPSTEIADGDKVKISLVADSDVKPAEVAPPPQPIPPVQPIPVADATPAASPEASTELAPAPHDFDRFLDDLVSEFESNPSAYPDPREFLEPAGQTTDAPAEEHVREEISAVNPLAPLAAALAPQPADASVPDAPTADLTMTATKEIPSGVHPPAVLEELLAAPPSLNGIVVCVGINEFSQLHKNLGKAAAEKLLGSVDALMGELLRGKAFLCRKAEDEFILIEPELTGAFAQRRLNDISERLWDFQLRNLGSFSVVFSWGAHEAHGENLRDSVEAAQEKMRETQAARKSSSFEKLRRRLATA